MQSIFEIKNPMFFDESKFQNMKDIAKALLSGKEKKQYTQAIVLLSSLGNEYSAVIENALSVEKSDEKALLDKLISASDTKIDFILCLWHECSVDIPSYDFRKMLCALNPDNANSGIFVITRDGYSVIKLGNTLK